jgi:hypothetical protein
MATSGTTTFDLDIDDIIEEAYERCGVRQRVYQLMQHHKTVVMY